MKKLSALSLVCVALIGVAVSGCGGDSDSDSGSASGRDADRQALEAIADKLGPIAENDDAAAYCQLFEPGQVEATMGGQQKCIEIFEPLLKKATVKGPFVIESIEYSGDTALVTFEGANGSGAFEKVGGKWYSRTPSIDNAVSKDDANQ